MIGVLSFKKRTANQQDIDLKLLLKIDSTFLEQINYKNNT